MADGSREGPLYGSTRGYMKGDFLKVKNIQLAYNLPKNALSSLGIKSARVYVNADTPFIFSDVTNNGLDPEIYDGRIDRDTPSVKMFSLGLDFDF